MKKLIVACVSMLVIAIGALALFSLSVADEPQASESDAPNPAAAVQAELLSKTESEVAEGADVIVSRVTIRPNFTLPWHWHPGEEYTYVLSGSATVRMEGEEDVVFGPGDFIMIPFRRIHSVETGDEGATVVVFRVHQHGAPERVMVE